MQEVYDYIQECDNILIASLIYFSELTGQLLAITSRLQTYFCAKFFRKETTIAKRLWSVLTTSLHRTIGTAKEEL